MFKSFKMKRIKLKVNVQDSFKLNVNRNELSLKLELKVTVKLRNCRKPLNFQKTGFLNQLQIIKLIKVCIIISLSK